MFFDTYTICRVSLPLKDILNIRAPTICREESVIPIMRCLVRVRNSGEHPSADITSSPAVQVWQPVSAIAGNALFRSLLIVREELESSWCTSTKTSTSTTTPGGSVGRAGLNEEVSSSPCRCGCLVSRPTRFPWPLVVIFCVDFLGRPENPTHQSGSLS